MQSRPPRAVARLNPNSAVFMNAFRSFGSTLLLLAVAGCATLPTNPAEQAALDVLGSGAGLHEKARACQELAVVGGPRAVPALAALLDHEQLADYARSGLESIRHPSAGAALTQGLGRLQGRQLAGAVNSLGVRREVAAVPQLEALAVDGRREVATEALASLGMIGNAASARILGNLLAGGAADLRIPTAHAALVAAERLAQDGNSAEARELLDRIVAARPSDHLVMVARNQSAALVKR